MKILSIECSSTPCSVAITEDNKVLASAFSNVKLTHSQTLMPMIENVLSSALTNIQELDGFAVGVGPGSFTGIRIGISAIKGMAAAKKLPCASVSTLRAMAENFSDTDCIVCAVMDARCNQVYNAIFDISSTKISRLCDDRAVLCDEVSKEVYSLSQKTDKPILIVGDGADIFYEYVKAFKNVSKASAARRFQNAVGVAAAAEEVFLTNCYVEPNKLTPVYLRLPQAERDLRLKKENER